MTMSLRKSLVNTTLILGYLSLSTSLFAADTEPVTAKPTKPTTDMAAKVQNTAEPSAEIKVNSAESKVNTSSKPSNMKVVPVDTASELKNRFRVDHMVSSMTLMIQREYGSAPVVIVLPDGSKWYANRHPETVKWVDGMTGDIM